MASQNPTNPRLVIIEGEEKGRVVILTEGTVVIGRSKGDITIPDSRISRSHLALNFEPNSRRLTFSDLNSLNGTYINGRRMDAGHLQDGDKLQVGDTVFDCQIAAAAAVSETPAAEHSVLSELKQEPKPGPLGNVDATDEKPHRPRAAPSRNRKLAVAAGLTIAVMILVQQFLSDSGKSPSEARQTIENIRQLQRENKWAEAQTLAQEAGKDFPKSSELWKTVGDLYSRLEKNEMAISAYRQAHNLNPDDPILHIRLIRVLLRSGLGREAGEELGHVDAAIREGKHSKELFIEAAQLFLEFRELEQSPEKTIILAKALQQEYAQGSTIGYKLEAQAHLQAKRTHEAVSALLRAQSIDPSDEWTIENLVMAYLTLKDMNSAESLLADWTRTHPASTKPLLIYAYLRSNQGEIPKAISFLQRIFELAQKNDRDPYYPEALFLSGQIYDHLGQAQEATQAFQKSCRLGFPQSCNPPTRTTTATAPAQTAPTQTSVAPTAPAAPVAPAAPAQEAEEAPTAPGTEE